MEKLTYCKAFVRGEMFWVYEDGAYISNNDREHFNILKIKQHKYETIKDHYCNGRDFDTIQDVVDTLRRFGSRFTNDAYRCNGCKISIPDGESVKEQVEDNIDDLLM